MRAASVSAFVSQFLLIAGVLNASAAPSDAVTLVTPVVYGTHLPGLGAPARDLARAVKERSGGALQLDLKEPGEGTAPHEILDKVSDGKVDAGFATAGFWAAKLPAAGLFGGFPFGPNAKGYLAWFNRGHARALYQEMYEQAEIKVRVIPCGFGGAETGGWFAKEIASREDIDGLRMRIFGLGARVMSRLGAVPILLPGSRVADAFEKNEIDAAELYSAAVDRTIGVQDAVKRLYMPGWFQPATVFELLVNDDRWAALGPENQALIETTCREMLQTTLSESANLQAAALATLTNTDGVQVETLPSEVVDALREAWREVVREEGVRGYFFKEVLADIEAFRGSHQNAISEERAAARQDEPKAAAKPTTP